MEEVELNAAEYRATATFIFMGVRLLPRDARRRVHNASAARQIRHRAAWNEQRCSKTSAFRSERFERIDGRVRRNIIANLGVGIAARMAAVRTRNRVERRSINSLRFAHHSPPRVHHRR
jgi:hypothetical protein